MSKLNTFIIEVTEYAKNNFAGFEAIQSDKTSFSDAINILKNCLDIVNIKLRSGRTPDLLKIKGHLIALKHDSEDIIDS